MKQRIEHAASSRSVADPLVVAIEIQGNRIGYGETLPRKYVTGEDHDSVERAIREVFVPLLLSVHPESFSEALEIIESLPLTDQEERAIPAARAAVELALLDVYSRYFARPIGLDVTNWLELSGFGRPGSIHRVRCSGILASTHVALTLSTLRKMRCYGLRDFKLKVGFENDDRLLRAVLHRLGPSISKGRATLRLDANGVWSLNQATERLKSWSHQGICCIEQPLAKGDEENLPDLKAHTHWLIMHDESLVTMQDAARLLDLGVADCFNVRISKCGGFIPSLKLANFCRQNGIEYSLGCMVGQTGILSAVERRFLECVPGLRFVESSYSRFLLKDDITHPSLRFGYAGKLRSLAEPGWGVKVDEQKILKLCDGQSLRLRL